MNFEMITPKELDRYLHRGDTFIIDLRPPKEYRERHLKGAVNIPYEKLSGCCLFPRDRLLLFYCDPRGSMSMAAAREYAEKGYRTKRWWAVFWPIRAGRQNLSVDRVAFPN